MCRSKTVLGRTFAAKKTYFTFYSREACLACQMWTRVHDGEVGGIHTVCDAMWQNPSEMYRMTCNFGTTDLLDTIMFLSFFFFFCICCCRRLLLPAFNSNINERESEWMTQYCIHHCAIVSCYYTFSFLVSKQFQNTRSRLPNNNNHQLLCTHQCE